MLCGHLLQRLMPEEVRANNWFMVVIQSWTQTVWFMIRRVTNRAPSCTVSTGQDIFQNTTESPTNSISHKTNKQHGYCLQCLLFCLFDFPGLFFIPYKCKNKREDEQLSTKTRTGCAPLVSTLLTHIIYKWNEIVACVTQTKIIWGVHFRHDWRQAFKKTRDRNMRMWKPIKMGRWDWGGLKLNMNDCIKFNTFSYI